MKKLLITLVPLVLLFSVCLIGAFDTPAEAATPTYTEGYYTYTVSNGEATITNCDTSISGNVTVPSALGGYPVTALANSAFANCTSLTNITLPDSVTSIGSAFFKCHSLTSIDIGNNVTFISEYVASHSESVTYNEYDNAYYLGNDNNPYVALIKAKTTDITSCHINENTKLIANNAFADCSNLASITIPDSVTTIGNYAFWDCDGLTSITIPDSVTAIGVYAFCSCEKLTSITLSHGLTAIAENTFISCTSLTSITVPDGVTTIGNEAFWGCRSLTSITIPDSVTAIGREAFYGCSSLTSISVPNSVTAIGRGAFSWCSSLTDVTLSNSITTINHYTFRGCVKLMSITVPDSVTTIGNEAFYRCESLTNITLSDNVKTIDGWAFDECNSLTDVFFVGADRSDITSGTNNVALFLATWHYNAYQTTTAKATLTTDGSSVMKCPTCGKASDPTPIRHVKTFSLSATSFSYDGKAHTPKLTVKDASGKVLIKNVDYKVAAIKGGKTKVGTYTIKVTMIGDYAGTKTLTYKIAPVKASKCSFSLSATTFAYNGKAQTPKLTVKDASGKVLTKNVDYKVAAIKGGKINVGTYEIKVTMIGNYSGTKTITYKIVPAANAASKCTFTLSATSFTYNGKAQTPKLTVKDASGKVLTKNVDYKVAAISGGKTKVGTYTIKVTMIGDYAGTKTITYKINPPKTSVSKLTAGTKSFTVAITKKSTQVTGYQVQYATNTAFTGAATKTIDSYNTTSATYKTKYAKTYYVRVRTYKILDGKTYYSGWSAYKAVKTK